ncbi:MAG: AAA family ATPase, partial [Anaerolineales bacterium]|nr:AAA family ATPase [Anaerolineales bacterium]
MYRTDYFADDLVYIFCFISNGRFPSDTLSPIIPHVTDTLLQTKLYIPPTRPNIVPRIEMLQKLAAGLHGKLTLASAPAGFGKTTLITAWLSQLDRPVGWVSLDEDDSDPQQFFRYVAAAIRPFPDISHSLTSQLQSAQPLPAKAMATALVHDLVSVSTPCLLVLDDYHEIDSADIDLALAFILDHLPPNLHLIITSRADPGFPLSRLRARNQLTELRANDLRFSVEETAVFMQNIMGISLTPEQIAALEARTEGWVAGLQMAALSMQNRDDVASFIDNFTGSHRFIMD